ncbi:MAG: penicillin-binding transpeptidase domain-containing protein, partial [Alphaproteobacteria bacterium]
MLEVDTGDVLALASKPSFDPNLFAQGIDAAAWRTLIQDPLAPLSNKAVAGQYAPGSTFKMLVALAALEHGLVSPQKAFFCNGVHKLGRGSFHCWRRGGHGWVAMNDAIEQSCDVYFYEVARKVGIDRIAEMSRRFGLGAPTGIDLPVEKGGLMPTRAWKQQALNRPWQAGETLIAGIGQGFVLTTPLQLAVMTARHAKGGHA